MTTYRTVSIDGLDIFYREAGSRNRPTILLLHGFPTSSYMFRNLIPALADQFYLIAPDYPGFGYSSMPRVDEFDYTFERLAKVMAGFVDAICASPNGRRQGRTQQRFAIVDHICCFLTTHVAENTMLEGVMHFANSTVQIA
jgi:pimeloyl-ACP methyl ester carboxylesterase